MRKIEYLPLPSVPLSELTAILNDPDVRRHLVDHPVFTEDSARTWAESKQQLETVGRARVRAVVVNQTLVGWCGVQPDSTDNICELAMVLSPEAWGVGPVIFRELRDWAHALEYEKARLHLLESRKKYQALEKLADSVSQTELIGRCFTTYELYCQAV